MSEYSFLIDRAYEQGGARSAANTLRQLAFYSWCPPCQGADHWNHSVKGFSDSKDEVLPGECASYDNVRKHKCTCIWRSS